MSCIIIRTSEQMTLLSVKKFSSHSAIEISGIKDAFSLLQVEAHHNSANGPVLDLDSCEPMLSNIMIRDNNASGLRIHFPWWSWTGQQLGLSNCSFLDNALADPHSAALVLQVNHHLPFKVSGSKFIGNKVRARATVVVVYSMYCIRQMHAMYKRTTQVVIMMHYVEQLQQRHETIQSKQTWCGFLVLVRTRVDLFGEFNKAV